jgi:serine phosphatase RsbU (regulator of sigma subunit)
MWAASVLEWAATRTIESFGGDGLRLGIDSPEVFAPHRELQLGAGDVLLLLTDGFMERDRTSDKKLFGTQRLKETLSTAATGSAQSILQKLEAASLAFAEGEAQNDDTTVVAIKRV